MNAFRFLFLAVVLVASAAIAMAVLVPEAASRQLDAALDQRARLEAQLLDAIETSESSKREGWAARIAMHDRLVESLSAPPGFPAPSPDAMFRQASNRLWNELPRDIDAVVLLDGDASIVDERSRVDGLPISALVERSGAASVLRSGTPFATFIGLDDRLYAVNAVPVTASTRTVGAVILAQEYDAARVAERRSGLGANATYFHERQIIATTVTDPSVLAAIDDVLRRINRDSVGLPSMLRTREALEPETREELDRHRVMIAPVYVGPQRNANEGIGAGVIIAVEGPPQPTHVLQVIGRSGVLDAGIMQVLVVIALGLIIFFSGLVLLDAALERATRRLAKRIREDATSNDPAAMVTDDYPVWLRDVADSFNSFLDAYRTVSPAARRVRQGSQPAIDTSTGSTGSAEPSEWLSGESAPVEVTEASDAMFEVVDSVEPAALGGDAETGMFRVDTGTHVTIKEVLRDSQENPVADLSIERGVAPEELPEIRPAGSAGPEADVEEVSSLAEAFIEEVSGPQARLASGAQEPVDNALANASTLSLEVGDPSKEPLTFDVIDDAEADGEDAEVEALDEFELVEEPESDLDASITDVSQASIISETVDKMLAQAADEDGTLPPALAISQFSPPTQDVEADEAPETVWEKGTAPPTANQTLAFTSAQVADALAEESAPEEVWDDAHVPERPTEVLGEPLSIGGEMTEEQAEAETLPPTPIDDVLHAKLAAARAAATGDQPTLGQADEDEGSDLFDREFLDEVSGSVEAALDDPMEDAADSFDAAAPPTEAAHAAARTSGAHAKLFEKFEGEPSDAASKAMEAADISQLITAIVTGDHQAVPDAAAPGPEADVESDGQALATAEAADAEPAADAADRANELNAPSDDASDEPSGDASARAEQVESTFKRLSTDVGYRPLSDSKELEPEDVGLEGAGFDDDDEMPLPDIRDEMSEDVELVEDHGFEDVHTRQVEDLSAAPIDDDATPPDEADTSEASEAEPDASADDEDAAIDDDAAASDEDAAIDDDAAASDEDAATAAPQDGSDEEDTTSEGSDEAAPPTHDLDDEGDLDEEDAAPLAAVPTTVQDSPDALLMARAMASASHPAIRAETNSHASVAEAAASDLNDESDDADAPGAAEEAEPKTVPRVSMEELAARAKEARSDASSNLLDQAEARLRALRPESGSTAGITDAHRELYQRFVDAKVACGEDTAKLTYPRFVGKLERNREALKRRFHCRDVSFDVQTREGRVTLKATPLR